MGTHWSRRLAFLHLKDTLFCGLTLNTEKALFKKKYSHHKYQATEGWMLLLDSYISDDLQKKIHSCNEGEGFSLLRLRELGNSLWRSLGWAFIITSTVNVHKFFKYIFNILCMNSCLFDSAIMLAHGHGAWSVYFYFYFYTFCFEVFSCLVLYLDSEWTRRQQLFILYIYWE